MSKPKYIKFDYEDWKKERWDKMSLWKKIQELYYQAYFDIEHWLKWHRVIKCPHDGTFGPVDPKGKPTPHFCLDCGETVMQK